MEVVAQEDRLYDRKNKNKSGRETDVIDCHLRVDV